MRSLLVGEKFVVSEAWNELLDGERAVVEVPEPDSGRAVGAFDAAVPTWSAGWQDA